MLFASAVNVICPFASVNATMTRPLSEPACKVALAPDAGAVRVTSVSGIGLLFWSRTIAVIGDVPYGTDQEAAFGSLITAINDDPKVRDVVHVGDIKSGSVECTDARFAA